VRIESLAGEPCRLTVAGWDTAVVRASTGAPPRVTRGATGEFAIELAKGAAVVLAPSAATTLPDVGPVLLPSAPNPWPMLKRDSVTAVQ